MRAYVLTHLSDDVLLRDLAALVAKDRSTTTTLLAHIAEVDARRLFAPAGYPSMRAYCVEGLHLSEDSAAKRIHAARAARQFPELFKALEDGKLHLTAVRLLAPHLTPTNYPELIAAATHKTRAEVELLLANHFPRTELMPMVQVLPARGHQEHTLGQVDQAPGPAQEGTGQHAPGHAASLPRQRVAPIAPERFELQLTIGKETHEKLRHAQALLSHSVPNGDITQVLDRALEALIKQLERRKLGTSSKAVEPCHAKSGSRHIPMHVRRAVWKRDHGQCTFVGDSGHRCSTRRFLEYDHIEPYARGGLATVEGVRLRCRTPQSARSGADLWSGIHGTETGRKTGGCSSEGCQR